MSRSRSRSRSMPAASAAPARHDEPNRMPEDHDLPRCMLCNEVMESPHNQLCGKYFCRKKLEEVRKKNEYQEEVRKNEYQEEVRKKLEEELKERERRAEERRKAQAEKIEATRRLHEGVKEWAVARIVAVSFQDAERLAAGRGEGGGVLRAELGKIVDQVIMRVAEGVEQGE